MDKTYIWRQKRKSYVQHLLDLMGGPFFLNYVKLCNYDQIFER